MSAAVYLIGAGRTDFARHLRNEGKTIRDLVLEAGRAALQDAGIAAADIQAGVVGNFASGLFTRQQHLGAFLAELDPALRGLPTARVEAACASGGVAVLTAAQKIMAGLHEVIIVVGVEQQKTMPPADAADVLGAAADYHVEKPQFGAFMFPKLFARIAQVYMQRHGATETQLALVPAKNRAHARRNPLAQMRDVPWPPADDPMIAPPLTARHCSPITDGGAALVLCCERFAKKLGVGPGATPARPAVRLLGYGHTTDYLPLEKKETPDFPIARRAAEQAYRMAGLGPADIHGADVHDCFSVSEIIANELLGLRAPGRGTDLLAFVNPGGGLLGDGHPVGATGVRQVVEAYLHLTDRAGARQLAGARRYLTFNIGGTYTTNVCMIWGRED
jgi:acetyl-CoA C-acetyltransferase